MYLFSKKNKIFRVVREANSHFAQFIQAGSEENYYLHLATQWYFSGYFKEHSQKVATDRDTVL